MKPPGGGCPNARWRVPPGPSSEPAVIAACGGIMAAGSARRTTTRNIVAAHTVARTSPGLGCAKTWLCEDLTVRRLDDARTWQPDDLAVLPAFVNRCRRRRDRAGAPRKANAAQSDAMALANEGTCDE
jgi:hypothetical protein